MRIIIKLETITTLLVLLSFGVKAQSFSQLTSNNYGVSNGDLVLADLDRNDTLDLIVIGVDSIGLDVLRIYNLDTNGKLFVVKQIDIPAIKNPKIQVSDISNNGFIDLLITGSVEDNPYFNIYVNKSNFEFEEYTEQLPSLNDNLMLSDFTNDGFTDLVASKSVETSDDTLELFTSQNGLFTLCDTCRFLPLKNTRLLDIDVNSNGFSDVLFSGWDENDDQKFYLYENIHNNKFDTTALSFVETKHPVFTKGDFTQNGYMDVAIGGKIDGIDSILIYQNNISGFELEQGISVEDSIAQIISADFTNDGLLDFLVLTERELVLYFNDGSSNFDTSLIYSGITKSSVAIGDFDRDNDQDIFITGVVETETLLKLFLNENSLNTAPTSPNLLYSFPSSDSVILQWNEGNDDSTNPISLSYNVFLDGPNGSVMPIHSGANNRALSNFGLQSFGNEITLKGLSPGTYKWFIQAIDNSLVDPFGVCNGGSGSGCSWVFEIGEDNSETYNVCTGDTIKISLTPSESVQWFSANRGELDFTDTLNYIALEYDTVYANYTNSDCETRTFTASINILTAESIEVVDMEICARDGVGFDISELFIEAQWYFKLRPDTIRGTVVEFNLLQSDSLTVKAISENGCSISKTVFIQVNNLPTINAGTDESIIRGESTNLLATGGTSYNWSPPDGLSNTQIAGPTASPNQTTNYTVIGTDQNNCTSKDDVMIVVKEIIFVPNLFSPNGDGSNDQLKVYGANLEDISFKIYNLQGKLVFETNSMQGAQNIGWDGTYNSILMPQGDYLWAISGVFIDGTSISDSGKVTLIR